MTARNDVRRFLARLGAFLLAGLVAAGCDQIEESCTPEDGCDGIEAIVAVEGFEPTTVIGDAWSWPPPAQRAGKEVEAPEPADVDKVANVDDDTPTVHPGGSLASEPVCRDEDDPLVSYVSTDPEVCATVFVICLRGWAPIDPACGCGCEYVGWAPTDI